MEVTTPAPPQTRTVTINGAMDRQTAPQSAKVSGAAAIPSDIYDDPFEDGPIADPATPEQVAWVQIVNRIATDFPQSDFRWMDVDRTEETARSWAEHLAEVPADKVPELYARVIRDREGTGAPTLREFQSAWRAWQNEMFQAQKGEAWKAHDHERTFTDKRPLVSSEWHNRIARGRGPVVCKCTYHDGTPCAAVMDDLDFPRDWICAKGVCDFAHPVEQTMVAPIAAKAGPLSASVGGSTDSLPKKVIPKTFLESMVALWNVDLDKCTAPQVSELTGFARWWQNERQGIPSLRDYDANKERWHADRDENMRRVRGAVAVEPAGAVA